MCVNCLRIYNNKLDFDPRFDKTKLIVPCGKCEECQQVKSSDYEIRCICEYKFRSKFVYFFTLTYSDPNLPIVSLGDDFPIPCFDVSIVQKFIKRLRSKCTVDFKYFLSSEYGGLHGRPHHHILIFSKSPISSLKKLIHDTWLQGFVYPKLNDVDSGIIRCVDAISYACKYVCKGTDIPLVPQAYKDAYGDLFRPFHLQSIGLGDVLCDSLSDKDFIRGEFSLTKDKPTKFYRIPLYIIRKCLYFTSLNKHGNVQYRLNRRGINVQLAKCLHTLSSTYDSFKSLHSLFDSISMNSNFNYREDLDYNVFRNLSDENILDIAKYKCFYYGMENINKTGDYLGDYYRYLMAKSDLFYPDVPNTYSYDCVKNIDVILSIFEDLNKVVKYENYLQNFKNNILFKKNYYGKRYKEEKKRPLNYLEFVKGQSFYY